MYHTSKLIDTVELPTTPALEPRIPKYENFYYILGLTILGVMLTLSLITISCLILHMS